MPNPIKKYTKWLHTKWPAGTIEKLPLVNPDNYTTNIPGIYIVGDLTGIPLLKFAADSGAKAVNHIIKNDPAFAKRKIDENIIDIAIIGAGVSGYSAAMQAQKLNLNNYQIFETSQPLSTIINFPKAKPIYTYPTNMQPQGNLQFHEKSNIKEGLLEDIFEQIGNAKIKSPTIISNIEKITRNKDIFELTYTTSINDNYNDPNPTTQTIKVYRIIIAIGRSGNYRKLNIPGENLTKVFNRLHDPKTYTSQNVLVVGGGDSALESAIALSEAGANVTLSYRKPEFSRPKPENLAKLNKLTQSLNPPIKLKIPSTIQEITEKSVVIKNNNNKITTIPNDTVFLMTGREPPLDFLRQTKIKIKGDNTKIGWLTFIIFVIFLIGLYDWKSNGFLEYNLWNKINFPANIPATLSNLGSWWSDQINDRATLIGTIAVSMKSRSFYYTLTYTAIIAIFGWQRIKRRKTPYITVQTTTLFLIQFIPLFLLPEIILPYLGYNGVFTSGGLGQTIGNNLFELYIPLKDFQAGIYPDWGHPAAYWRAYGFILAWPLNVYNVFTNSPNTWWIIISIIQTFIIIPLIVYRWGKGAFCGWICSCGALAETLGDTQRHKMPHGPLWNRLNMLGQIFLAIAFLLLFIRIAGWIWPGSWMNNYFPLLLEGKNPNGKLINPLSYKWFIDILVGGVIGVGLYFKYSGRVWCRFACPLAALMHIYARFSRFRIFADKNKCISCNVCTSVCHQGIDIMNFANKGLPMSDPQCVRCSACVQSCPTGVLTFGRLDKSNNQPIYDKLNASPVKMTEITVNNPTN